MKTIHTYIKTACLLALTVLLAACEKDPSMTDITIDRTSLSLLLGDNAQITVQPVPVDANVDVREFEWSSDNEAIATVTRFGIVHTVEEGTCNITVKHGSFSKSVPVTITDPVVVPAKKGHWKFEGADLRTATTGQALVYGKGGGAGIEVPTADASGFTSINGPKADNKAVRIAKGYFFRAAHGLTAPQGYPVVPEYTLMFDFRIPATGSWYTFFQTEMTNSSDGEVFIRPAGNIGVGSTGYSEATVSPNEWHRLVVSGKYGDGGWYNYYLDGALVHTAVVADERFGLDLSYIYLLADNDGDDADIDISEIAIWQEPLDALQVKKLERAESKLR
ncbi:MAG: Ig-like domain-containing protein [Prevotellaceae bacterium]|nr:Ig-like domain-containing protein [Prevotellaceae bacterium]